MEDNLESVLHCDDKEKLRRKLALLQREYSRTVQRLQRAERSDAVRKHVRSRISEQNLQDQTDPGTASTSPNPALPSLSLVSPARTAPGSASPLGLAGDSSVAASCLVESENPRWSPSVRFLLSLDDSCPRTPDLNPDPAGGHRRSPSLRLRSRRSRQRWERRGRAQGGEGGRAGSRYDTETSEDGLEPDAQTEKEEEEGEKGKEEERETPYKEAMKERRAGEEREEQRKYGQKEIEKEGANLRRDGEKEREKGGDSGAVGASELGAVGLCDLSLCDTGGVLDSCTLVEGLPFPVEYYIRTTRRMASSQSHRDLQAVILNQLNRGRHRRSRGRTSNTHTLSDSLAQPSNSQTNHTPVVGPSANQMLTSESGTNQSECLPSRACSVRPIRGRRRRGRGRRPRLGRSLSLDSEPPAPGPDNTQTPGTLTLASQPLPGGGGPERWPLSGGVEEQLYPIFRRSCGSPLIHTPKQRKESMWSLLLPHLPSLSPGGPAVHPGSLGRVISTFDLQDFHLPDDQFGRLKLQKLRASSAVAVPEPEPFSPYNMRRRRGKDSVHGLHGDTGGLTSKAPTSEPISLSLTPPVTDWVAPVESVEQSIDRSIGQHLTDHPIDQQSTDSLGLSTDLHSEYHSVCQSTDHPVDQPIGHQSTDHPVDQPIGHQSTDHQLTVLVGQSTDFPSVDQQTGLLPAEGPSLRTETETECPTECLTKCTTECPSFHTKTDPKCPSMCPTEFSIDCLTKCPALRTETDAECAVPPSPSLFLLSPSLTSHTPHGHTLSLPLSSSPPLPSLGMTPNLLTPNPLSPNPDIPLSLPDSPQLPSLGAVTLPLSCAPCPPTLTLPLSCTPCPPTLPLPLSCAPCPPTMTLPLSCAPCPPTLTLPFPYSPSTQALSPPSLSPCPSPAISLSPSPPSVAPCRPSLVHSLPQLLLQPAPPLLPQTLPPTPNTPPPQLLPQPAPSLHSTRQATEEERGEERGEAIEEEMREEEERREDEEMREEEERREEEEMREEEERKDRMREESVLNLSYTLKSPAGGSLVDVCCVSWPSVGVCVAVAGEWEVCVWGQTTPPHWRRLHTWTFIESVMSVFPVPDAPGLLCVTLGRLEIREARVLCCSSLSQAVLCEGEVQTVVGMSNRRLVSSSHSAATPLLQVYTLTEDGRLQASLSLVCPTERVQTVAAVEGQTDALIGSTHSGHLVLWNVTTGQLLRSITLGDGFTDTACLRGYSLCGVLFVLLQHPSLCALEEEEGGALFSLVATNPLTGTFALATRLGLPKSCTGRLVEVDVHGSSVVGVFRSGSICVWQLGGHQGQRGVWLPEMGCLLARWGAQGTVLTAHLNGDVCLHRYRPL